VEIPSTWRCREWCALSRRLLAITRPGHRCGPELRLESRLLQACPIPRTAEDVTDEIRALPPVHRAWRGLNASPDLYAPDATRAAAAREKGPGSDGQAPPDRLKGIHLEWIDARLCHPSGWIGPELHEGSGVEGGEVLEISPAAQEGYVRALSLVRYASP